jgi:hypothetical protein
MNAIGDKTEAEGKNKKWFQSGKTYASPKGECPLKIKRKLKLILKILVCREQINNAEWRKQSDTNTDFESICNRLKRKKSWVVNFEVNICKAWHYQIIN